LKGMSLKHISDSITSQYHIDTNQRVSITGPFMQYQSSSLTQMPMTEM